MESESKNSVCRFPSVPYDGSDWGLFSRRAVNMFVDATAFRVSFLFVLE